MKRELVIATTNQGKLREIKELLKDLPFRIRSLKDYPHAPAIVEDGKSFKDNALIKAVTMARLTKRLTMGEDSGLEVKALGDNPGIYSARYSGANATDQTNNAKLLRQLKNVADKNRQAQYHCCAVLVDGSDMHQKNPRFIGVAHGLCSGLIVRQQRGENGFGYDPLFLISRYGKTFGELDPSVKAKISHRARALKKLKKILEEYLASR